MKGLNDEIRDEPGNNFWRVFLDQVTRAVEEQSEAAFVWTPEIIHTSVVTQVHIEFGRGNWDA